MDLCMGSGHGAVLAWVEIQGRNMGGVEAAASSCRSDREVRNLSCRHWLFSLMDMSWSCSEFCSTATCHCPVAPTDRISHYLEKRLKVLIISGISMKTNCFKQCRKIMS